MLAYTPSMFQVVWPVFALHVKRYCSTLASTLFFVFFKPETTLFPSLWSVVPHISTFLMLKAPEMSNPIHLTSKSQSATSSSEKLIRSLHSCVCFGINWFLGGVRSCQGGDDQSFLSVTSRDFTSSGYFPND